MRTITIKCMLECKGKLFCKRIYAAVYGCVIQMEYLEFEYRESDVKIKPDKLV